MFCPKCGVENQEDAKLCHSCSWVLTSVGPTAPAPDAKTSALAVASLVLGILGFCTLFLTAPLAIILGIVGIFKIEKSNGQLKGKGLAIAGMALPAIAIPVIALFMGIMIPSMVGAKTVAYRMVCGANMSGLGREMLLYANDNNEMYPAPDHWCDMLIKYDPNLSKAKFRCKGDKQGPSSFAMNKNIEKLGVNAPPDMVVLFESKPGWNQAGGSELLTTQNHDDGCNVLFSDGHVAFIKAEDINNLQWTVEPAKIKY